MKELEKAIKIVNGIYRNYVEYNPNSKVTQAVGLVIEAAKELIIVKHHLGIIKQADKQIIFKFLQKVRKICIKYYKTDMDFGGRDCSDCKIKSDAIKTQYLNTGTCLTLFCPFKWNDDDIKAFISKVEEGKED